MLAVIVLNTGRRTWNKEWKNWCWYWTSGI